MDGEAPGLARGPSTRLGETAALGRGRFGPLGRARNVLRATRSPPGHEMGGDDGARRRADVVLAAAKVKAGVVLEAGQDSHHPRLAEDAAAAEDQDVGERDGHRVRLARGMVEKRRPFRRFSTMQRIDVRDNVRSYAGSCGADQRRPGASYSRVARGHGSLATRNV